MSFLVLSNSFFLQILNILYPPIVWAAENLDSSLAGRTSLLVTPTAAATFACLDAPWWALGWIALAVLMAAAGYSFFTKLISFNEFVAECFIAGMVAAAIFQITLCSPQLPIILALGLDTLAAFSGKILFTRSSSTTS